MTIYTSDDFKPGTDSNVYIQIFGDGGDTGYRKLMASKTNTNKLEPGNVSFINMKTTKFHVLGVTTKLHLVEV